MLTRLIILAFIVLILASLFSALLMLFRKDGSDTRMVKALTIRIGLSIALFVLLLTGFHFGIIAPGGAR